MIERDPQSELSDGEALSALIDGALSDEQTRLLRERLAREPELAGRLASLERADSAVRARYASVVDEPLPESLLALLEPDRGADVVPLHKPPRPLVRWLPAAAAAAIALAVGLAIGVPLGQRTGAPAIAGLAAAGGAVSRDDALHALLESLPSGRTVALGAGVSATPRFTFRTAGGGYCRTVGISGADLSGEALACRDGGAWRLRAAAFEPGAAAPRTGAETYRPASRAASAVDASVDALIVGSPLDGDAEAGLIASEWGDAGG